MDGGACIEPVCRFPGGVWNTGEVTRDAETTASGQPPGTEPGERAENATPAGVTDDVTVLPWWHSKLNLAVLGILLAVVSGMLGFVNGNNTNIPDPNPADIGFLQDMHWHHDQAVEIALTYLSRPGIQPELRTIATEIVVGQSQEIGMMVQLLRSWGRPEINETDVAMGWMGEPVALARMPGLATDADLAKLAASTGHDADTIFVTLMTAHHQGGIHMAEAAAARADIAEVGDLARQMAGGQREEIAEMAALLQRST